MIVVIPRAGRSQPARRAHFTRKDQASAEAYDESVAETIEAIKTGERGTLVYTSHRVEGERAQ